MYICKIYTTIKQGYIVSSWRAETHGGMGMNFIYFSCLFSFQSPVLLCVRKETKRFSDSGALARAAEHHGGENLVIHASEKFW